MEEILKLVTASQSERSKNFMFLWRILICVLLTNKTMNHFGYVITNETISPNLVLKFIFSPEFVLATMIYLIYVFTLFWSIKILGFTLYLILSNKQISKDVLLRRLVSSNLIVVNGTQETYSFKDDDSIEFLNWFIEDRRYVRKSELLSVVADILSVISSVSLFYPFVSSSIPVLKDKHIEVYLLCLDIISFLIGYIILYIYAKSNLVEEIFTEISNNSIDSTSQA